jgi:hypothetical protein
MPTIEKFPRTHKFTIGDRIQTIALDVLEALIEATYTKERTQHLRQANLGPLGSWNLVHRETFHIRVIQMKIEDGYAGRRSFRPGGTI